LLTRLEKITGLQRLRLSSIEPIEVDDALIDWVASSPKACAHFHLPLQSGSDAILQAMRRPYATADFRQVVEKIRARMPLAAITTDLIVGFPGETEELFAQTMAFLEEMQFSRLHIFKFSPRDGTPAATMPDQISNADKSRRSNQVEQLWQRSAENFHRRFVGREVEVLWETCSDGFLHGFSREYVPCRMPGNSLKWLNEITPVTGIDLADGDLVVAEA
jgi:threonylcarbamoyladenosine tRNA methylthiotransferase MtaB